MQTNDSQMLILCALTGGPKHGYAINAEIEALVGERLGPGSLYGALTRLEAKGLIAAGASSDDETGRQRMVAITDDGRAQLERHLTQMARISRIGLHGLGLAGS